MRLRLVADCFLHNARRVRVSGDVSSAGWAEGLSGAARVHLTEHALAARGAKFLIVFEWMEVAPDEWTLCMEYDHSRLERATIKALDEAIGLVLAELADGCSRADISARLGEFFAPSLRMEGNYATYLW